ncbi:MAG: xanthine dehydrogenase family protein molybdopterin-binding subunit [Anderseniella sp.]
MQKFAMGQAVRRVEDERFLKGEGRYVDDIALEGMAHAAFVRSPFAHAKIGQIDTEEALAMPGVIKVLTYKDVKKAGLGAFPTLSTVDGVDENGIAVPERFALTGDVARFVGDPVAMVIAETPAQAQAAAEAVMVDYADKPAAVDLATVLDKKTPRLHTKLKSNQAYHFHKGDKAATDKAIKSAAHVTTLTFINNRLAPSAVEPRGCIGDYDKAKDQVILHVSGQAVHGQKGQMADTIFKVPHEKVRVVMPDVGGGFGAKNFVYPENVMVMLAAKLIGRPVKWIAQRTENFLSEIHGRDHLTTATLALDSEGNFTALKVETRANMGAYLSSYATIIPTSASWVSMGGNYRIPSVSMAVDAVFTNTVPVDAYRGAGRPESAYVIERLVDLAAFQTGRDPIALRRQNFIREYPHKMALGMVIDTADFDGTLNKALKAHDADGFAKRRTASERKGKLRGLGVSSYLEVVLGMPADFAEIRFEDDGAVSLLTGGTATGQGHETTYKQIIASELGIDPSKVRYITGDTDVIKTGGGHGGSRSLMIIGSAVLTTSHEVVNKGKLAAGHLLEAAPQDIEFKAGKFTIAGTDRAIGLLDLQSKLRALAGQLPKGVPDTLSSSMTYERKQFSYPNGVHVCEVEVDPDTGTSVISRYTVVDDFGRIINPLIAGGQVMGGAVQGIGQALLEGVAYDETGQLLTGSFMDYCMPRAHDIPDIGLEFNEDAPTQSNPLGVKGAGEAGATGAPPAVVNAVMDALKPFGIGHIDMPLTPFKVWSAIQNASTQEAAE